MSEPYSAADGLVRVYPAREPNGTGLVWAHGGGFAMGDIDMPEADWLARTLAARGTTVVSVDYRLAPPPAGWWADAPGGSARSGHHYPAASDDVLSAWSWTVDWADRLRIDRTRLALGGGSAGGNLAAGATLRLIERDAPTLPALVLLAYPTLLAVQPAPSPELRAALDANPEADRFGPEVVRSMYENYLGGPVEDASLGAVPALARPDDVTRFPPTLIVNSEIDELRVSAEVFAATLEAAGRDVEIVVEPGTDHGHLNRPDAGRAASDTLGRFAARLASLPTPPYEGRNMTNETVDQLIARSNRLGADPKNTNYAGGNTSAKGTDTDPVTGEPVKLLWVKGSGGDLGTLTPEGLAVLRLDRMRALVDVYPGVEREDEMVAAFEYCLHGKGGAAPSIDTAMHGLVDAAHVDHLHPDSGIAIATAADGEELTRTIFGDKVVWVPWRRPGFQLGLDIAEIKARNPQAIGTILGGHGITAWGDTSDEAERNSLWIIETAQAYIDEHGEADPFGGVRAGFEALPDAERRARAAALAPTIRGLASTDRPMVGHFTDSDVVLDFLASEKAPALAELGTSCPDHFLRTKVKPMLLDLPATAPVDDAIARLKELHAQYRADYQAYYDAHATADSPAIRGADPLIVLVPGVGMFSYGANKQTARVAGEFYVNAINVMRGAEALSTYSPISDAEKFRIEYWALEEAKLQRMPKPKTHQCRIAFVTGAASGIGKAIATRLAKEGACVVVADLDLEKAQAAAAELGNTDVAVGVAANVADADAVQAALDEAVLAFGGVDLVVNNAGLSLSKPLLETTEKDWDLQHDVMAKGSFFVSKAAARILIDQKLGGDIVYIASKNSLFAGPNNIAYSATKADQAHQVRLLAVELGEHGIRVNGINPDGVVRGSGIFASGWGANRAATYGVKEEDLGQFYANRTILKREVVPENVADAVFVLTGPELSRTTGLHIPVDSGVAAAFLR